MDFAVAKGHFCFSGSFKLQNRRFSYAEIVSMTSNFQQAIGKGGFGTVYYGQTEEGTQVAVKMLSENSPDSSEFQTEAQLLVTLHHRNLVRLIGYCAEGNRKALVLEYMCNGNLAKFHLESSQDSLSWNERVRIALDVAQGLEYQHVGCKPPIIHRDIKSTNILLTEHLEAKITDFGVSKVFLNEYFSHISTQVKGTLGYLDPEYYISNNLNEKSDVYSFGVVLLELITGLPAIFQTSHRSRVSLVERVSTFVSKGDIASAVDPNLGKDYDMNSAWKAFEVAMACTSSKSMHRPTISEVTADLKKCLGIERGTVGGQTLSKEFESAGFDSSLFRPQPR